jgi:hypothetical protein
MPKRSSRRDPSGEGESGASAPVLILGMVLAGATCLAIGGVRYGLGWRSALSAASCLAAGIGFVAVGLMEIEWLEKVIGFVDGLFSGLAQWFWASDGTLSDTIGRHRATVVWVVIGFPCFIVGCLMALRIIPV